MPTLKYWDNVAGAYVAVPGAPGQVYAQVAATAPPAANPTIAPPMGALWVDTSTTVPALAAQAYFPPQTPPPTGFNTFTDVSGTVWVSRNGSAWRKALEVLHARYYLPANYAAAGSVTLNLTGVSSDPLNCAGSGGFLVPLAGLYSVTATIGLTPSPATASNMQVNILRNGAIVSLGGTTYYPASNSAWPAASDTDLVVCAVNDLIQNALWTPQAVGVMGEATGARTYMTAAYIGPA
jgi:hypothetical protein